MLEAELDKVMDGVMMRPTQSPNRLVDLADFSIRELEHHGLQGAIGGSRGELRVQGLAREKDWDVAYEFAGKYRLLISLKSMWKNAAGTIPNRLDDHMGEIANIQQLRPEIVIGYVVVFDVRADSMRKDGARWSEYFESAIKRIAIRRAPLWNQGLLEGSWFIRIDGGKSIGKRLVEPEKALSEGEAFFRALLTELRRREPAIPFADPRS